MINKDLNIREKRRDLKRSLLAVSAALVVMTSYYSIDHVYHPSYEIVCENQSGPFAKYSKGCIYIGSNTYLNSLTNINEYDILVEDQRFNLKDPNMKIHASHRITSREERNEILEVLCYYEACYPSPWDRSLETMRLEWLIHNISYFWGLEPDRSGDVDLDNNEEKMYDNKLLSKLLKI